MHFLVFLPPAKPSRHQIPLPLVKPAGFEARRAGFGSQGGGFWNLLGRNARHGKRIVVIQGEAIFLLMAIPRTALVSTYNTPKG